MGTPGIPKNSALAKSLAETLGTTVEALHRQFKAGDQINFYSLKESDAYKDRVSKGRGFGDCENAYVVDNGDGKISKGDLFLHVDGLFQINCKYAFTEVSGSLNSCERFESKSISTILFLPITFDLYSMKNSIASFKNFDKVE